MKVAYIAGPYRAGTPLDILKNIQRAGDVALKYWKAGYAVICPHKNTSLFDGQADDSVWLEGDLELLRRSDLVVMMAGWHDSAGARREHDLAKELGIEIAWEPETNAFSFYHNQFWWDFESEEKANAAIEFAEAYAEWSKK